MNTSLKYQLTPKFSLKFNFKKNKSFLSLLSLIFLAVYSLFQVFQEDFVLGETVEKQTNQVMVTRVVDGDTFEIEGGKKVRLIGVDAPESVHPKKPVECYGKISAEVLKQLVEGKRVTLEKDVSETDRYGRLLRYVFIDGESINQYLVAEGYAYASSYPPDVSEQDLLTILQTEARVLNKGLWGKCQTNDIEELNELIKDTLF